VLLFVLALQGAQQADRGGVAGPCVPGVVRSRRGCSCWFPDGRWNPDRPTGSHPGGLLPVLWGSSS
jgi:hypothetical protein